MNKEDRRILHEIMKDKNKKRKLENLANLFERNKDDYSLMFTIVKLLGTFPMYRDRAKELMGLIAEVYNPYLANYELGKMEVFDKNYSKAINHFNEAILDSPNSAGAMLELGKAYKKSGDLYSAKKKFLELASNRTDKAAFYELGVLAFDNNEFDNARVYFKRVLDLKENDSMALFKLGLLEEKCGNYELAKEYFAKASLNDPNDVITLTKLSACERLLEDFDSAKVHIDRALSIEENSITLLELGLLYEGLGLYDKAYGVYIKALKYDEVPLVNYKIALLLKQSGLFNESKKYLYKCLDTEFNANALSTLADISLKEGNVSEAEVYLSRISSLGLKDSIDARNFNRMDIYIKHKKNMLKDSNNHYISQLTDYDEDRAIEVSKSYFGSNTDVSEVFEKVKGSINDDNYHNTVSAEDFYIVDLSNPAYDKDNSPVKKVIAITVLNSDKIISFMPTYKNKIRLSKKDKTKVR